MSRDMQKDNIPSILVENSKDLIKRPQDVRDVDVEIKFGVAFEDYIREYYLHADATVVSRGGALGFELAEFEAYVRTLIASRIAYVRHERHVIKPTTRLMVPTVLSFALNGLGLVKLDQQGLVLRPIITTTGDLLDETSMRRVSNRLELLQHFGFVFAPQAYDRDNRGAADLMVLQFLTDQPLGPGVYSHTDSSHPAFALLAYLFELKQLQGLLGARIIYGDEVSLRSHLRGLVVV